MDKSFFLAAKYTSSCLSHWIKHVLFASECILSSCLNVSLISANNKQGERKRKWITNVTSNCRNRTFVHDCIVKCYQNYQQISVWQFNITCKPVAIFMNYKNAFYCANCKWILCVQKCETYKTNASIIKAAGVIFYKNTPVYHQHINTKIVY